MAIYSSRDYRMNAAMHRTSHRDALANARNARQHRCRELAARILNEAQHYRRMYAHRMRQARMAAEAEGLAALAAEWQARAEATDCPHDRRFCIDTAEELSAKSRGRFTQAYLIPRR